MKTKIKFIKKGLQCIQSKIDKYVLKRFEQLLPEKLITVLYKKVAKNDLVIDEREIRVKKGKIKYTLFIVKDKDCKTIFNLGRNLNNPINNNIKRDS